MPTPDSSIQYYHRTPICCQQHRIGVHTHYYLQYGNVALDPADLSLILTHRGLINGENIRGPRHTRTSPLTSPPIQMSHLFIVFLYPCSLHIPIKISTHISP